MNNFDQYVSHAYKNSNPIFTTIELTHKCNFACMHCYNFDRTKPGRAKLPQLGKDLVFNFLEELKNEGGLIVNFSGGEPLLHPNIVELIAKTKELNLIPRIKTNAFFLDSQLCKTLKENGLDSVDISMYGFSNQTYELFTKAKNGFKYFLKAVNNLKEEGLHTQINIIIHRGNFSEVDQMINFCKEENLSFEVSCDISDRYDESKPSTENVVISDDQFEQLLRGANSQYFQTSSTPDGFQCSCARSVCGLSVTGDIYPCIGAPIPSGNINDNSFHDIWNNSHELNKIRNITTDSFKDCNKCDLQSECVRSSGEVFINTGDYLGCDPGILKKAQIRKKVKENI
jgi:radical SAM protein with 4Fe4S-binding SPASM domain